MPRDPIERLKAAAAAELRRATRWARFRRKVRRGWRKWVAFWKGAAHNLAIAAKIVASVTAIAGGIVGIVRLAGLMRARDVGRAEEPATGVPSTAQDFITKPEGDGGDKAR